MDKTGTLTEGNFTVSAFKSFSTDYTENDVLKYMGALEKDSSHPLSIGVLKKLEELNLTTPVATDTSTIPGVGIEGTIDNQMVKIVSVAYLTKKGISYDQQLFSELSTKGNSVSFLLVNEKNIGLVAQGDQIKPEAKTMIQALKAQNIKPVMLTGD